MSNNKQLQKLELTWIGKGEEPKLEPRILIEDPEYSYGDPNSENMLIHGDNLLALKALEQDFAGKVKCIYIDPPYNINAAGIYDDNIEHSIWLSLMKQRLQILKSLLHPTGVIFVQIDDYEMAYLQILMDEIFTRSNRLNTIAVKMSEASGVKMSHSEKRLPKIKEYILGYKKSENFIYQKVLKLPLSEWNDEYKVFLENFTPDQRDSIKNIMEQEVSNHESINELNTLFKYVKTKSVVSKLSENGITKKEDIYKWKVDNAWRIIQAVGSSSVKKYADAITPLDQEVAALLSPTQLIYLYLNNYNRETKQPRIQILFADDNLTYNPGDFWTDIKTTGGVGQEGGVLFPNGKKPEQLIHRIIDISSNHGDIILDSFLGSGTTAAVAHKMGRRWIGIELGEHAKTHCYPRLKQVVDGEQGGISKALNWHGGAGFKFYTLASSLLKQDKFGNWVISKEYNADRLAAAMAKQEGFKYQPHQVIFWKQGQSSEHDFIFTTTQFLTVEALDSISDEMQPGETLLICCKSYQKECKAKYGNISIKKIPQMLLGRCEYGKEDYSLNIVNMPTTEQVSQNMMENQDFKEDKVSVQEILVKSRKQKKNIEPTLFD